MRPSFESTLMDHPDTNVLALQQAYEHQCHEVARLREELRKEKAARKEAEDKLRKGSKKVHFEDNNLNQASYSDLQTALSGLSRLSIDGGSRRSNPHSARSLFDILGASDAGDEIQLPFLRPILREIDPLFADPHDFEIRPFAQRTPFAPSGFCAIDKFSFSLSAHELLCLNDGIPSRPELTTDFSLMTYFDENFLEELHASEAITVRTMLTYMLLVKKAKKSHWIGRNIAIVDLAELAMHYRMKDRRAWTRLVEEIISANDPQDTDPLGQVCLIRLASTTRDSDTLTNMISPTVSGAMHHAHINAFAPIGEILSKLSLGTNYGNWTTDLFTFVIMRKDISGEIAFVNTHELDQQSGWMCCTQPTLKFWREADGGLYTNVLVEFQGSWRGWMTWRDDSEDWPVMRLYMEQFHGEEIEQAPVLSPREVMMRYPDLSS